MWEHTVIRAPEPKPDIDELIFGDKDTTPSER
jgi:hypothetical protein